MFVQRKKASNLKWQTYVDDPKTTDSGVSVYNHLQSSIIHASKHTNPVKTASSDQNVMKYLLGGKTLHVVRSLWQYHMRVTEHTAVVVVSAARNLPIEVTMNPMKC